MCSWILTEDDELIVRSNIRHARKTERPNLAFEVESQHVKGSLKNFPLVDAKQIYKDNVPGTETKAGPQIFNPHKDLIGLLVPIKMTTKTGKEYTRTGTIKEKVDKDTYQVALPNGKQRVLEYNELITLLNRDDEDGAERWDLEAIIGHR